MSEQDDLYKILGVNENDSDEIIKKAYKKLAIRWHPDKNQGNREEAERKFKEISHAFSVIGDKDKRKEYDSMRRGGFSSNGNFQGHDFNFHNNDHNFDFYNDMFKNFFKGGDFGDFSAFDKDDDLFSGFSSNFSNMSGGNATSTRTSTTIINGKKITKTEKTYFDKDGQKITEISETTGDGKTTTTKMIGGNTTNQTSTSNNDNNRGGSQQLKSNFNSKFGGFEDDDFFTNFGDFARKGNSSNQKGKK